MEYFIYFAVTILILVFIHELGHFIAAKMSGMRVDVFAIGFGKRLIGYNKITGFTKGSLPEDLDLKGNTDYRISLLPLGGYVKIAGMIDESMDTNFTKSEPAPDEFRAKPTYKKLFVISAGVIMNILLAVAIFTGINYFHGEQIAKTTEVGYVSKNSAAADAGFETGDKILSIDGTQVESWNEIAKELTENFDPSTQVVVERNGTKKVIEVNSEFIRSESQESFAIPMSDIAVFVSQVMENSPAEEAGLKAGDIVLSLDNKKINDGSEIIEIVSSNKNNQIPAKLLRDKDTLVLAVTPSLDGKIGIGIGEGYTGEYSYKSYGPVESFTKGFSDMAQYGYLTVSLFKNLITGNASIGNNLGGPITIAKLAADTADLGILPFLRFLAILSLSLAIMNLLPLPVLDGGHLVIIIIEGFRRRELPLRLKIAIQNVGFFLLMIFMVVILYYDILRW